MAAEALSLVSVFTPSRLGIPAIGVDAGIEQVHILDGVMQAPADPWRVGWYSQLAFPGQAGNVVMAGHKDWWDVGPAVFWDLGLLARGDTIVIHPGDGTPHRYGVSAVEYLAAATSPTVYTAATGQEQLMLMTCSGTFDGTDYDERLIVLAMPERAVRS